jgi:hypothetical protein
MAGTTLFWMVFVALMASSKLAFAFATVLVGRPLHATTSVAVN